MPHPNEHPMPPYQLNQLIAGRLAVQRVGPYTYRVRLTCWCASCSRFTHWIVGLWDGRWDGTFCDNVDSRREIVATMADAYRDAAQHLRLLQMIYCRRPLSSLRGSRYES